MFHLASLYLPPPPNRPEICEGILSKTMLVKLYLSHWGHHPQTLEEPGDIEDIHLDTEVIDDIDYNIYRYRRYREENSEQLPQEDTMK